MGSPSLSHRFSLLLFIFIADFFSSLPSSVDSYVLKSLESLMPIQHSIQPLVFTDKDLALFDGSDEKRGIYVAIRGIVFDVTKAKSEYGKAGQLNALAGRDASRAIAKMSTDPEELTDDLAGLTDAEMERLDNTFIKDYQSQFPVQGFMVKIIGVNTGLFPDFSPGKDEL